jgi:hypothetical protein
MEVEMSMTRDDKIKCDECGKLIGIQDLVDGKALHHCVLPSSHYSDETFESLCAKCYAPPDDNHHVGTEGMRACKMVPMVVWGPR